MTTKIKLKLQEYADTVGIALIIAVLGIMLVGYIARKLWGAS